ncbi:MAG: hypothetical protein ABMA00_02455 [Gemmatimonas sp.]
MSFPALIVAAAALVQCGGSDSFLSPANFENVDRQFDVWAITGSSAARPAGYQFTTESLVRPQVLGDGSLNFDVAFDITADGKVLVLPARLIVPLPPAGAPSMGFTRQPGVYEQIQRATDKGYVTDSSTTMAIGETITIRLLSSGCVYGEPFYAKLTIDDINVAERRLLMRTLVNRNCGYRSLVAGVPKD